MGKKESLQEKIKNLSEKLRFFRNILLGLLSGLVGVIFGMTQGKIKESIDFYILFGVGIFSAIFVTILIYKKDKQINKLIERLENIKE